MAKGERAKGEAAQEGRPVLEKIPTGIPGLDELTAGGFERGSTVLVCGETGTGKTTFGLQFLYNGAREYGEAGLFISFCERAESLYRHAASFGWDFAGLEKAGLFRLIRYEPHEVAKLIEEGGGTIRDTIDAIGAKRIVLDSLTSYSLLFESSYRTRESVLELFDLLQEWQCTSLLTADVRAGGEELESSGVEFLVDGIILLYHPRKESVRLRALEVLKLRGSSHAERLVPFTFEKNGIVVYPVEEVFEKV
ncbi:MAG: ATPase domain-containing protein [Candidatus Micrarchaeia archaeon]